MYMIYKHGWFWDIPWIKLFFSPLLHHFSPQLFPAHHVGNLPKPESPGCRFSSFCPMKLAWMLQVLAWDYGVGGNHLPPRMGRLRSFFFWRIFNQKKPEEWWFSLFLREHLRQQIHIFLGPFFFLFGIGQGDLSCKVDTVRGKEYWWNCLLQGHGSSFLRLQAPARLNFAACGPADVLSGVPSEVVGARLLYPVMLWQFGRKSGEWIREMRWAHVPADRFVQLNKDFCRSTRFVLQIWMSWPPP